MNNFSIEFLERCRCVTRKFESYEMWAEDEQLLNMYEEVSEVQKALKNNDYENILEECSDVILATITMFDKLGVPHDKIQQVLEKTLQKVEKRVSKGKEAQ